MRDHPAFRIHKNRTKLFLWLCQQYSGVVFSFESVVRAQRKLWQKGLYLPLVSSDRVAWLKARREGYDEFFEYTKH